MRFTSCQAPVAEAFARTVVGELGRRLAIPVEFVDGIPWQERLRLFDAGEIDVCWMCGLPYVWRADRGDADVELLAAPVPAGRRYGGRAVYFSDVVVRADSPHRRFPDLEGARWAYNEDTSHSGYFAPRHYLAGIGRARGFFGRVVASGSHEASLRLLFAGEIDAFALDSTVRDLMEARDTSLGPRLRTVETLGPSPRPPWVVRRTLPRAVRLALRRALIGLADDRRGRAALRSGLTSRFSVVTDADYEPLRRACLAAAEVEL